MRMRALLGVCVCVVLGLGANPQRAAARREVTFNYPYSRVWTTAVRLMRVDFEAEIKEKDKEDGYFLFEYPDRGKTYAGSMELISVKQDDLEAVRVVLTIQALPTYVENMVMDRLTRKLSQEFGPPPERKPEKRPPAEAANPDGDEPPAAADRGKRVAPKQSRDTERPGGGAKEESD